MRVHHSLSEISCQLSGTTSNYREVGFRQWFGFDWYRLTGGLVGEKTGGGDLIVQNKGCP